MPTRVRPPDLTGTPGRNGPHIDEQPKDAGADLYQEAQDASIKSVTGEPEDDEAADLDSLMLGLVESAYGTAENFQNRVRAKWEQNYRAFRSEHLAQSKYLSKEYKARSKFFRPKTRSAVRRFEAGVVASLFSTVDAVAIGPGNEADPQSRAGAALLQEVVNYRLDRTSGRNAIPWFLTVCGAAENAMTTGVVTSKQHWLLQKKQVGEEPVMLPNPLTGEAIQVFEDDGETPVMQPVFKNFIDRPDIKLVQPENVIIDAGADWLDPAQSAAFLILRWPMKIDEIRQKEKDEADPWEHLPEDVLLQSRNDGRTGPAQGVRSARQGGTDRQNPTHQSDKFADIWVNECYVKYRGEDYTFWTIGHEHYLSRPRRVEEVYPEQHGERPVVIGYGSIEAHNIFPMAPVESWRQMQAEINDLANLTIDTIKMNIAPVAKVRRGRQVDLDALRKRGPGTNLLMQDLTDVEFDKPPGPDAAVFQQMERLNNDFDGLAGQFDAGSVQANRQLNETVGGMRLISGAANAMQEFDQRIFLETWAERALAQVVRLCQHYEEDSTILGLCGERAQLWQKHGVDAVTDKILEQQITVRIDIGVGAGDPQQRIAKFQQAASVAIPLLQNSKKFASGEYELDEESIMQEVFGAAGYRDGGQRFIRKNPPQPNPLQTLEAEEKKSVINKNNAQAEKLRTDAWAGVQGVLLDKVGFMRDLTNDQADQHQRQAEFEASREDAANANENTKAQIAAKAQPAGKGEAAPKQEAPPMPGSEPGMIPGPEQAEQPREQDVEFIRNPNTGEIVGARITRNGVTRVVQFSRGQGGRIAHARIVDAGAPQRPAVPLPPANIRALAPPVRK